MRERKLRERLARRRAILAGAAKVFAAHGPEGAATEMVARETVPANG
jgi:AcrR family transcriptional regulator